MSQDQAEAGASGRLGQSQVPHEEDLAVMRTRGGCARPHDPAGRSLLQAPAHTTPLTAPIDSLHDAVRAQLHELLARYRPLGQPGGVGQQCSQIRRRRRDEALLAQHAVQTV